MDIPKEHRRRPDAGEVPVALAHQRSLRLPNQPEFDRALQKVIRTSKEAGTVDRARKYLAGL
jgi:hypothetical protein